MDSKLRGEMKLFADDQLRGRGVVVWAILGRTLDVMLCYDHMG